MDFRHGTQRGIQVRPSQCETIELWRSDMPIDLPPTQLISTMSVVQQLVLADLVTGVTAHNSSFMRRFNADSRHKKLLIWLS